METTSIAATRTIQNKHERKKIVNILSFCAFLCCKSLWHLQLFSHSKCSSIFLYHLSFFLNFSFYHHRTVAWQHVAKSLHCIFIIIYICAIGECMWIRFVLEPLLLRKNLFGIEMGKKITELEYNTDRDDVMLLAHSSFDIFLFYHHIHVWVLHARSSIIS